MNSKPENADRTLSLALYVFFGVAVLASGVFFRDSLIAALYSLETTVERLDYWGPILVTLVASLWAFWVLHGELRGALGESRESLGGPLVVPGRLLGPVGGAKGLFGRHFGSP